MIKQRLIMALALAFAVVVSGCSSGSSKEESAAVAPSSAMSDSVANVANNASAPAPASGPASRAVAEGSAGPDKMPLPNPVPGVAQKIIYKGSFNYEVKDYEQTQNQIKALVTSSGGYIMQFEERENPSSHMKSGLFTIKVPSDEFGGLLQSLEKIPAENVVKSVTGQDVTEEYVDLSSRLKAKELVESRLLTFMEKATKTDELLAFSQELAKVQEEIEKIKGRMRYLDQNVAFSTIDIRIQEVADGQISFQGTNKGPFSSQINKVFTGSIQTAITIFQGIFLFVVAVLPFLLIAVVFGVPIWWILRKRRRRLNEKPKQEDI